MNVYSKVLYTGCTEHWKWELQSRKTAGAARLKPQALSARHPSRQQKLEFCFHHPLICGAGLACNVICGSSLNLASVRGE